MKIDTSGLGIIDSDEKKVLECYIDERLIRQRKSFDEYIVDQDSRDFDLDIRDLRILAEKFNVQVTDDEILLSN
jgi:hypothetical protein